MQRVGFLRAVNLGSRKAPMATVKAVVERLGYDHVWTLANSGNVVFDAGDSRAAIERKVGDALAAELGFEVTTFVRSVKELGATMALRPFAVEPGDTYFVTFLAQPATRKQRAALEGMSDDFDTLVVQGRDVHWLMHGRSIDTHITSRRWESVIGRQTSTSRNTTMLDKLLAKIDARDRGEWGP